MKQTCLHYWRGIRFRLGLSDYQLFQLFLIYFIFLLISWYIFLLWWQEVILTILKAKNAYSMAIIILPRTPSETQTQNKGFFHLKFIYTMMIIERGLEFLICKSQWFQRIASITSLTHMINCFISIQFISFFRWWTRVQFLYVNLNMRKCQPVAQTDFEKHKNYVLFCLFDLIWR